VALEGDGLAEALEREARPLRGLGVEKQVSIYRAARCGMGQGKKTKGQK
jgi:hypothetical protein